MPTHYRQRLAKLANGILALLLVCVSNGVQAEDIVPAPVPREFQLDVKINGQPAHAVSQFSDMGDGRFASRASELRELGIRVPDAMPDGALVPLDDFAGVSYVYDEQNQAIALEVPDTMRVPKAYDARGDLQHAKVEPSDFGAVLNYTLFGTYDGTKSDPSKGSSFNGVNASLDARLMMPVGVISQTGIAGATLADETNMLRLDTTYTFSDQDNLVTYRAGDVIQGGLGWTRPIRMGGVQAQRTFAMRPDLVTTAMPGISGSAAVPSTVDVFVNGVKSYSQDVGAGPFQISNIPSITGAGVAQVVTRDAAGRETVQTLQFYTSPHLLRPGLVDFSAEAGVPRQGYGRTSFDYDTSDFAASATFKAGLTEWLSGETHGEVSNLGLLNAGAGLVAQIADLGIVSAAFTSSTSNKGDGFQVYGSFDTKVGPVSINARAQHALDNYEDLASQTAYFDATAIRSGSLIVPGFNALDTAPARAIDTISLSMPIAFDKSSISGSFVHYERNSGDVTNLISATYTRPLIYDANLYLTGYADIEDTKTAGVYLGINMPLGDNSSVTGGVNGRLDHPAPYIEATKSLNQDAGSWGWRVRDYEGDYASRSASIARRLSAARVEAGVYQDGSRVRGTGEVEGAVAILGGDIYTSNRIDDSFAVADAHAPGVNVLRENTVVGKTNEDGKILIPSLLSYQKNKIAIDPMDLPLDAEINTTQAYVAPSYKSGVYVEFDVHKAKPSAIVILHDVHGKVIAAGSEAKLEGSDEPFLVGYDGQTFLKGLGPINTVHVKTATGGTCSALVTYHATSAVQPVIGPEVCQ